MRMNERYADDRPREKLAKRGAGSLSDYELLMAIIGNGNAQADVTVIARAVQKLIKLHGSGLTYDHLLSVKSLGPAKAAQIMAGFELWRRQFEVPDRPIIDSPKAAGQQLTDIKDKKQEHLVVLSLDGANRLITKRIVTIGTLTRSLIHPREVFADAITDRAAGVIIAHNHPSGNPRPSQTDKAITKRLTEAAELLGIQLVDHLVVTHTGTHSITTDSLN